MIQLKNNAQSMLAYPVSAADTTLTVIPEDIGRFPALIVPGDHFYCALADSQGNLEFVRVTGVNAQTATLTVVRGAEGTTARGWNTGDRVQLRMSMATWTDMAGDWWQRVKTAAGDALAPTLVSASSFSLFGDWSGEMQEGRRLRITASDGTLFKGHVASATLADGTTTVTVGGDPAPQLAGTLAAVDMGFSTEMESHLAKIWADEAEASKNAASQSETSAGASALAAASSETNAKASETAAEASKTAAATSETNAKASETSALASKNAAAASEANALGAATRAETAADNAEAIAGGLFVPLTREVTAGTGLSGGGSLEADRVFAVKYGTAAGTACEGNDARLSDSRTPKSHTHTKSQISDLGNATDAAVGLARGDGATISTSNGVLSVIASVEATAGSIVKRDASGNIVGSITGHATWADLAEVYRADGPLEEGDVVRVSPDDGFDVARAVPGSPVLGVVSLRPGVLLNCGKKDEPLHYAVARVGMVPVKVSGPVAKGGRLTAGADGNAVASTDGTGFAFANETKRDEAERLVMCIL